MTPPPKKRLWPWIALAFFGVIVALRLFVLEPFKSPAGSMIPTLSVGDHFLINRLARTPKRGDVIVFVYPKDPEKQFVKRVIAVGGDTVEVKGRKIFVNDHEIAQRALGPRGYDDDIDNHVEHREADAFEETLDGKPYTVYYDRHDTRASFPAVKVPPGAYYVLGDNRDNSHDSRYWGTVAGDLVRGTLWYRFARGSQ